MLELIDTSVRDGNQSLWGATGLNSAMMLGAAPVMDRVGFAAIDFTTSTHMAVAARFQRENPWERIRLMRAAMPRTPLGFLTTGMRFISWEIAHADLMRLAFGLLVEAGIRRFAIMDPMNDADSMIAMAKLARDAGVETIAAALTYTVSPVHDDPHYTARAKSLATSGRFDRLYIKDPGGLLTPERAVTLIPAVRGVIGAAPLELHSHCTIGLAPFTYQAAPALGVDCLHVAATPLANGSSQPAAIRTVANLRAIGVSVDVDDGALTELDDYFGALADAECLPRGALQEFDAGAFSHQMPGGMMGTLKRQLAEMRRPGLLPQVLEEVALVRAELGYPIMVTPFSQVVGAQAVMNIVSGKRYSAIPDEVIRYVIGLFGRPGAALDAKVEDMVRSSDRAKELARTPGMASMDELRARIGRDVPDEEFLLRATMPADQVDAMLAAGPAKLSYDPREKPSMDLLRALAARDDLDDIRVEKPGFRLELRRALAHS
jgi:oxaloacetate decarboxylase alpha subunit